ncbi:MAG: cellulase family glycosylhydrolase [Lachnospiraceae bacterium]|nr:cellulase family glycosylhydrolase [Lachnospiraceae bacterium]
MKKGTKKSRALALVLALAMTGLAACGNNGGTDASTTPTVVAGEKDITPTTEAATPTVEPTKAPEPTTAVPTVEPTPTKQPEDTGYVQPDRSVDVFDMLTAAEITEAMGAGWNLGNTLEGNINGIPSETAWQSVKVTKELFEMVKEAGFSSVRIPVSYLYYIGDEASGYAINEAWADRVNEVVDYAYDTGLYIILNMHGDGYESVTGGWLLPHKKDQTKILEKYAAVWTQIAERYADYDERLIFESMNEIGAESTCNAALYANINAYNQTFLDAVRQAGGNNDKRYVLIPGYNTNIDKTVDNSGFQLPEDTYLSKEVPEGEHRIMVSVHYYDPWSFCGGESDEATQWGVNADSTRTANWGEEAFMEQQFKKMYDAFSSKGYPVVIGEYGSIDKSHADAQSAEFRAYFAGKVCEKAMKYGLVPVYWDNGWNGKYGFAIFNRAKNEISQPEIVAAIAAAFAGTTAGEAGTGTATGITLSESTLELSAGAGSVSLTATLEPAGCADVVYWSSSNDSVATVAADGTVTPCGKGEAVITAKSNGITAECAVTVKEATATSINLYILETHSWQTAAGENPVLLEEDGSYSITMTVSKKVLDNIGSFYFKDTQVQDGILTRSLMKSGKLTLDSITVNGTELTLNDRAVGRGVINGGSFDVCLLNRWAVGQEMFEEFSLVSDGDYNLKDIEIAETNTIVVNFSMTGIGY